MEFSFFDLALSLKVGTLGCFNSSFGFKDGFGYDCGVLSLEHGALFSFVFFFFLSMDLPNIFFD